MKVLLLDTGFSALPIYEFLLSRGHEVWVMGNRSHDAIARRAGNHWIEQDYSDASEVGRYVERLGIDRLVPGCTDVSIQTCVAIHGGGGFFDRTEAHRALADKRAFRDLCKDLDLPAPRRLPLDSLPTTGRFICKPVDAFSGRGITVFDGADPEAAKRAMATAELASASGRILIEPFVDGKLYSWSAFIETGQVKDAFFVFEGSSVDPFAVDTSHLDHSVPERCGASLNSAIQRIATALGLVDGLVHTQFLWDGETASIVEIARRCPGDLYAMLVEYSTGYAYASKYASYFLGQPIETRATRRAAVLRHTVTSPEEKILAGIRFDPTVPVRAFYPLQGAGQFLAPGHAGRIGILFCEAQNEESLESLRRRFLDRCAYSVL
jgi:hypothetical protein